MDDQESLIEEFWPACVLEYQRIGFTTNDFRYLAAGGELTRARFEAALEDLRRVPSGIGADAYFASRGLNFGALRRSAESAAFNSDAT